MAPDPREILNRALAYHEAGHQVVAHALGVLASGIELHRDGGRAYDAQRDRVYTAEHMCAGDRAHCRSKIMILLAGEAAERLMYEDESQIADAYWSAGDQSVLQEHLTRVFGDAEPPDEFHPDKLFQAVEQILIRDWRKVGRLAQCLLRSQRVSGAEVQQLLGTPGILWDADSAS